MRFLSVVVTLLCVCGSSLARAVQEQEELPPFSYVVDLSAPEDDIFHVTLDTGPLNQTDRYFEFVAFAPGVHSVLNFGRFVLELKAWGLDGKEVPCKNVGMNRWELSDPTRVARITYDLQDTFGAQVEGASINAYAATAIEEDFVILNPFGVCGFFANHRDREVRLRIEHDPDWVVGTALKLNKDGSYHAPSFHRLADSPFLLGNLSSVAINVGEIEIEIFVHANSGELNAEEVMFVAGDMLEAAAQFIGFAPVKRYVLLVEFMDRSSMQRNRIRGAGALEHSYCSLYTMPASANALAGLAGIIAHEFMHILTPLHLRSTIIADFDYSIPTTDHQLWLYEGLTEWTADMLRLRGGVMDLEQYLATMVQKMRSSSLFMDDYSLDRLSMEWSTKEGLDQYGNIYQLGALTSMMLDIRILELSTGKHGLREVFRDLIHQFGEHRPFDDETFLDEFVAATYPEIMDFMRSYVLAKEPLPYAEYFEKLGIEFTPDGRGVAGKFVVLEKCSSKKLLLREAWMRNLD